MRKDATLDNEINGSSSRNNKKSGKKNRKGMKERHIMKIGSWNIRTMLQIGKTEEISREMNRYKVDILALQEIRWKGQGRVDKKTYTIYYSGEMKQGQNGTAFMVNRKVAGNVLQFRAISGRLSYLQIKNKQANISIVNAYAPTEESNDNDKIKFYEELEDICETVPKNDILLLVGDFNAKVGREVFNSKVAGKETIHDNTNDNGNRLCNLATSLNSLIVSTKYKHKKEHKITWMIPGSQDGNQIDHMLISRKWGKIVQDVRSYRGANADSDHYLIMAKLKMRIIRNFKTQRRKRWKVEKLKIPEIKKEYVQEMENRLKDKTNDIDKEWNNIKESMLYAADRILQRKEHGWQKEWFDEECQRKIDRKNQARNRWIYSRSLEDLLDYKEKRKDATKCCKKKKEQWIQEFMEEIEINRKDNRKLFELIKSQNKQKKPVVNVTKETWERYFKELYRENREIDHQWKIEDNRDSEETEPTFEEFLEVIKLLKCNKAPGPDEIINEVIKNGGNELLTRIHNIIVQIWKREMMPKEWKNGLLVPIFKKGDSTKCENYRGIMLLNTAYKILTSIIRQRIGKYSERRLGEYQQGFRKGRSTIDAIHVMTQIIEKAYEHNIELHVLFLDFRQAFDGLNRQKVLEDMQAMEVPAKLIRLTKMTMEGSRARVITNEGATEEVEIQTGVRQGDALSTTLFNIALDGVISASGIERSSIISSTVQAIAYADDIALIARSKKGLEETLEAIVAGAKRRGLEINQSKTKYMMSSRNQTKATQIKLGPYKFDKVEHFKYLGVVVNGNNDRSMEINERLQAGNRAYWSYLRYLKDKSISRKTKLQIYKTAIRPVVTYAAETMCLTQRCEDKLRVFERKILRKILGPKRTEDDEYRILWNYEINDIMEGEDIVKYIKAQRLRWFGHVERRGKEELIRKIKDWRPTEERPKGRPKARWEDQVRRDIQKLKINNPNLIVKNREEWNRVINTTKKNMNF